MPSPNTWLGHSNLRRHNFVTATRTRFLWRLLHCLRFAFNGAHWYVSHLSRLRHSIRGMFMSSRAYMREYMREYRRGIRRAASRETLIRSDTTGILHVLLAEHRLRAIGVRPHASGERGSFDSWDVSCV